MGVSSRRSHLVLEIHWLQPPAATLSTVLTGSAFGHVHTLLEDSRSQTSDLLTMPMAELVLSTFVQAPSESRFQPYRIRLSKEGIKTKLNRPMPRVSALSVPYMLMTNANFISFPLCSLQVQFNSTTLVLSSPRRHPQNSVCNFRDNISIAAVK